MWRQFDQFTRLLCRRRGLVLPGSMLAMHFRVIEHWLRQGYTRRHLRESFLILLEERIDHREHLPGNPTNDPSPPNVGSPLLIVAAFDGDQALIEPGPFTIQLDRLPDGQVD